jgi:protein SPT2
MASSGRTASDSSDKRVEKLQVTTKAAQTQPVASIPLLETKKPIVLSPSSKISDQERKQQQERVERLKAARRAEVEKLKNGKKRPASTKAKSNRTPQKTVHEQPVSNGHVGKSRDTNEAARKKLNFKDLMRQAEQIDSEKLKLTVKVKEKQSVKQRDRLSHSPKVEERGFSSSVASSPSRKSGTKAELARSGAERARTESPLRRQAPSSKASSQQPAAFSKPMPELVEKRNKILADRRRRHEDYDSDLDDFIEDDLEQDVNEDYDRDEIWKMFNRGRSRAYYEKDYDDDSDMEATGSQVFQEENRSAFYGRREDDEEEKRLETLADKKRRKLRKSR